MFPIFLFAVLAFAAGATTQHFIGYVKSIATVRIQTVLFSFVIIPLPTRNLLPFTA